MIRTRARNDSRIAAAHRGTWSTAQRLAGRADAPPTLVTPSDSSRLCVMRWRALTPATRRSAAPACGRGVVAYLIGVVHHEAVTVLDTVAGVG